MSATTPKTPRNVTIVVGSQWGDEGKGKWIDVMAAEADVVARFQGGNNAGHTLYVNSQKIVLHQIPSGIFHDEKVSAITSGVVVNPVELLEEIADVRRLATVTNKKLWLSKKSHVITPWQIHLDKLAEDQAATRIGTTKRGIGPTYSAKANRVGLRLGDFVSRVAYDHWLTNMSVSVPEFIGFYENNKELWSEFEASADQVTEYVCEAEAKVRALVKSGKSLLLEGAQGTLLDIDHGTYPFVTSSSTTAGGALASLGLAAKTIGKVFGIAKAYLTRVGDGPFPTELKDSVGEELGRKGNEFGATTNRPRRCGWYDAVAMRYAVDINGLDGIYVNKVDILSGFKTLKIAVAYEHPELGKLTDFPTDAKVLDACTPIYEEYPGWSEEIPATGTFEDLPANAKAYLNALEEHSGVAIAKIGTGPNRNDNIFMNEI